MGALKVDREAILNYLKIKIPDYSNEKSAYIHLLQFSVHVYPLITRGYLHPFILNFVNALYDIEQSVPGYAKKTIDWVSKINKDNFEQIIQIFSEVLVLRKVVETANPESITEEPTARKNGKNPEFRALLQGGFCAIEVKTASLYKFGSERQEGIQITTQFNEIDLNTLRETGKIVNSRALKMKDYLVNTQEKFEEYRKDSQYKDDFRLLSIIWDDYINEPVSALTNKNCGLLTDQSFYEESKFSNIDGVIIVRHIHQFFRNLLYGELVHYGKEGIYDSFDYFNPVISAVFVQNPFGREVPLNIINGLGATPHTVFYNLPVAEYQPTDLIDWKRGLSVSGIHEIPTAIKNNIIEYFIQEPESSIPLSYNDICAFGNISIDRVYENLKKENLDQNEMKKELFDSIRTIESAQQLVYKEYLKEVEVEDQTRLKRNKSYERAFKANYSSQLDAKCPCQSGDFFMDCCFKSLKHFSYNHYYDL